MFRRLLHWSMAFMVAAGMAIPIGAQDVPPPPQKQAAAKERPSDTLMITFAGIAAIVVLVVVCKPSRR